MCSHTHTYTPIWARSLKHLGGFCLLEPPELCVDTLWFYVLSSRSDFPSFCISAQPQACMYVAAESKEISSSDRHEGRIEVPSKLYIPTSKSTLLPLPSCRCIIKGLDFMKYCRASVYLWHRERERDEALKRKVSLTAAYSMGIVTFSCMHRVWGKADGSVVVTMVPTRNLTRKSALKSGQKYFCSKNLKGKQ